jgi:hypothetical protein
MSAFAALAAVAVAQNASSPKAATIGRASIAFPDRDTAVVTLVAAPLAAISSADFSDSRLTVGNLKVPVRGKVAVKGGAKEITVTIPVKLADVPEGVLDLPIDAVTVRWFGLEKGIPEVVVSGILDIRDRAMVSVREDDLRTYFARLGPVGITPGLSAVGVRVLLDVYNPFRFDLIATGLEYKLVVGERQLVDSKRAGFRLRAGQRSDILLEETIALTDAVGGAAGLLGQQPASLAGTLVLRTPKGERRFPMYLASDS